jgi:hypothetical protein
MAFKTYDFCLLLLLVAVLYTGACAEEESEDETVSVDRNSLSSIRLPSKSIEKVQYDNGMLIFQL